MQVQFIGATGTVTGSKYLVSYGRHNILIDCGLFQGISTIRRRNWEELPFAAAEIDAVLLTHAHIDHSGYLPALMKQGFHGPIYTTKATTSLCQVLLPDAGFLQEEDARYANKKKYSRHNPAEPLYTEDDARKVLKQFKNIKTHEVLSLPGGMTATYSPVGHILGACAIRLEYNGRSITFSGDVGRMQDAIMYPPEALADTDNLVLESTYGDRAHAKMDAEEAIAEVINRTIERGGIVLIPAFAVGRAQLVLYYVERLMAQKRIPKVPVYLNSPMAIKATEFFLNNDSLHKLNSDDCDKIDEITTYVRTTDQSIELTARREPSIIISASGMASGGRILHHLKALVSNPRHTVLFMGYQAPGTRGFALANGIDQIKLHGEYYPVNAEVINLDSLSSHADYKELCHWLSLMKNKPRQIFLTHGDPQASDALRQYLVDHFDLHVVVPSYLEKVNV